MKKSLFKLTSMFVIITFLTGSMISTGILENHYYLEKLTSSSLNPLNSLRTSNSAQSEEEITVHLDSDPGINDEWLPEDYDIAKHLMNNELQYQNVWEPWLTKAAVRVIATDPSKEFLAVGGGYLYDNEIHLYRWNDFTREYDKVWDTGDQIIQGDVLSIDFGDTDNNDFMEIVAGSADGHVYVFEQEHIYDPFDNMENQFVHVWTSPKIQQVWGVQVEDVDKDYLPDIIAGSWDKKIHVFEYINHSGYPFTNDHWIEYAEKTTIDVGERIFSLAVGDTNYNALPEIVVGTELGRVYIYENNGTILYINGKPWPLTQDNSYRYHWDSRNTSWKPVHRVIVDNLDDDNHDEIAYISNGLGVYVINFDASVGTKGAYLTKQLWIPLESWELGGFEGLGHYLNHYIDFMTWSNNNMTSDAYKPYNSTHYQRFHVYPNGTLEATLDYQLITNLHVYYESLTNTKIAEPFAYMWEPQWPKNTSMAIHRKLDPWGEDGVNIVNPPITHPPAENYTTFKSYSANDVASAILDWGKDGEVMGDGLWAIPSEGLGYDVLIRFHESTLPNLKKISFEISPTGKEWVLIPNKDISLAEVSAAPGDDDLWFDVDPTLSYKKWPYFRFMRINVTNSGYFKIKGGFAPVLYRPMDTATSLTIGSLDLDYYKAYTTGESEGKKIVIGTADGKIVMFEYNSVTKSYDFLWNSYTNDSYTRGTNIWDIVEVKSPGKIPTWQYNESSSNIIEDLPWIFSQMEIYEPLLAPIGEFSSVTHVSLFSSFFKAIFEEIPAYAPLKNIVELKIPDNDMVVGTTNGKLLVFPELTHQNSTLGNFFFYPVNSNPFYFGKSISPTFVDLNNDFDYFPEVMLLGWAGNGPGDLYNTSLDNMANTGIDVYTYDAIAGPLGMYKGKFELEKIEITGLLSRALEKSQRMPETAVGDMDGDGDFDIVVTNGRIYYLENINNFAFILQPEFFEDLNLHATDKLFDSPFLYDFDQDGDLDLTVGWSNTKKTIISTTYYQNIGTHWAPQWEENKWLYTNSWGGLRFNNLTAAAFAINKNTGLIDHITAYNRYTHGLVQLEAEYENHNAFVIGTNPIISRLELNLKFGTDSHGNALKNYGYHVFETWNSEKELSRWTLTLKTGDIDQDGRGEVIVGDFDNNMYVFEHLTNNTYKRAFRSQDITHEELSTSSPYAWELLEGVSGTFYRTIWDHINELVVGLDMDNDGFLEIVATAGLSIFVWEQKNNGWVSVDDEYDLIWQADLRQSAWSPLFQNLGISEFTASAFGGDLDYNGYGEFILAAGSFLFVFESNGADQFYENFLVDPFPVRGRYFVPGNPLTSPAVRKLSIEAIVVADTDNDNLNEIIIGGVNKTWWGQYNGFIAILENQIGTYAYTWWAPNLLMEDNPIFDLVIDNQDYDHYKEIIAGTFKGIVIYENALINGIRDNTYIERSILTSFVNFPYIKLKQMFDLEAKIPLALRNTDFIELQYDHPNGDFRKGDWIQIFKAGPYLYWANSSDYGTTWTQNLRVTTSQLLLQSIYPYLSSTYEIHPSIYQTRDGQIWLAFSGKLTFQGGVGPYTDEGIWLLRLDLIAGTYYWQNGPFNVAIRKQIADYIYNPSIWDFPNNTIQRVAISYLNSTGGISWQGDFSNPDASPAGYVPNVGNNAAKNAYQAISHDAIRSTSGKVIVVFTGRKYSEAKVDLDLWIARSNSTPIWDPIFGYSRATVDAIDELHPSITQTVTSDHTLMVIYEAEGNHPSGALHVTYSKNDGDTWRDPEPVTTTPPFATYISLPLLGFSLLVLKQNPRVIVKSLISVGPSITAHWEGGFAYSFMAQYSFFAIGSISITKNTASIQTMNQGYANTLTTTTQKLNLGDISSHSGLVEQIGGGMTTGGGKLTYQGADIGTLTNISLGGGGSALSYTQTVKSSPIQVTYSSPIITGGQTFTAYGGSILAYGDDAAGNDNPSNDQNTGSSAPPGGYSLAATSNFGGRDFHDDKREPNRGYYNNIFFGMNPSSNFTLFDFKEAKAISTGDSDFDHRREIAIASGSQAYLVEITRTGGSKDVNNQVLEYYQSWYSNGLGYSTTDIELYDANGNGIDEIIVSAEGGNVFSFEGVVNNAPPTNYLYLDWEPIWISENYTSDFHLNHLKPAPEDLTATVDIGADEIDDIIIGMMDPENLGYRGFPVIYALNGVTGEILWEYNLSTYVAKQSVILTLKATELSLDGTDDIVFTVYDKITRNTTIFALDGNLGTNLWTPIEFDNLASSGLNELIISNILGDNTSDIVITLMNSSHTLIYGVDGRLGTLKLIFSLLGIVSNVEHVSVGYEILSVSRRTPNTDNGEVVILALNGTLLHTYNLNNSRFGLTSAFLYLNDDDVEDVLILESGTLYAFNGANYTEQLWNNSLNGGIGNYRDVISYDFDNDGYNDLMFQVRYNLDTLNPITKVRFEDTNHQTSIISTKYDGLIFGGGTGWYGYNATQTGSSVYLQQSGDMAIYNGNDANFIVIKDLATKVSAYFSTALGHSYNWTAYDSRGNILDVAFIEQDKPNQFIELKDPEGRIYEIKVLRVLGASGAYFVMDDFAYHREPLTKLIALSGINPQEIIWEYFIWNTYANEFSQADIDRDGESDDLLIITEYTGKAHTGALTAIDGSYGTPLFHMENEAIITLDFEDQSHQTNITSQYEGLIFGGSENWIAYNASGSPLVHSGDILLLNTGEDINISFINRATHVSAYFSTDTTYSYNWNAYDYFGNQLASVFIGPDLTNQYVELKDPSGNIYYVSLENVSGPSGLHFVMDDLSYISPKIPVSATAGNFGEIGEFAIISATGKITMMAYQRDAPTNFKNVAIQTISPISIETRGIVTSIETGDFNKDGNDDIVFGDRARFIIALNGLTGEMIWKFRTTSPITRIAVGNFHLNDGYDDVAVALQDGILLFLNGETGLPLWKEHLGSVIFNDLKFFDQNKDGIKDELIVSLGYQFIYTKGRLILYNATKDTSTGIGTILWERYNFVAPFRTVEISDFNLDGKVDVAVLLFDHSIWILNGSAGTTFEKIDNVPLHDFRVGNFTGLKYPQIVGIIRNGTIITYKSTDWSIPGNVIIDYKYNLLIPFRLTQLAVGKFDNDTNNLDDLVVRSFGDATYAFNGSLIPLWRFEDRSIFYLPKFLVADLNNDSIVDIISLNHDNILALNGINGEVVWASFVPSYLVRSFTLGDFNNDDVSDLAVGTANRWVHILYGKKDNVIVQQPTPYIKLFDPKINDLIENSGYKLDFLPQIGFSLKKEFILLFCLLFGVISIFYNINFTSWRKW